MNFLASRLRLILLIPLILLRTMDCGTILGFKGEELYSSMAEMHLATDCTIKKIQNLSAFSPSCLTQPQNILAQGQNGLTGLKLHMFIEDTTPDQVAWVTYQSTWYRYDASGASLSLNHLPRNEWISKVIPLIDSFDAGQGMPLSVHSQEMTSDDRKILFKSDELRVQQKIHRDMLSETPLWLSQLEGVWFHKVEFMSQLPGLVDAEILDPIPMGLYLSQMLCLFTLILWLYLLVQARKRLVYAIASVLLMLPLILIAYLVLMDSKPLQNLHTILKNNMEEKIGASWEQVQRLAPQIYRECANTILDEIEGLQAYFEPEFTKEIQEKLRLNARIVRNEREKLEQDTREHIDQLFTIYCKTIEDAANSNSYLPDSFRPDLELCKDQEKNISMLASRPTSGIAHVNALAVKYARYSHPLTLNLHRIHQQLGFTASVIGQNFNFSRDFVGSPPTVLQMSPIWMAFYNQLCQASLPAGAVFSECNYWQTLGELRLLLGLDVSGLKDLDQFIQAPERSFRGFDSINAIDNNLGLWSVQNTPWGTALVDVRYSRSMFIPKLVQEIQKQWPDLEFYLFPPAGQEPWPYELVNQGRFHEIASHQRHFGQPIQIHSEENGRNYLYLARTFEAWKPYVLVLRIDTSNAWKWGKLIAYGIPILMTLLVALSLFLCLLISQRSSTPLQEILQACERIKNQDLSQEVRVYSRDEISIVVRLLNQVLNGLRQTVLMQGFLNSLVKNSNLSTHNTSQRMKALIIFIGFRDPNNLMQYWDENKLMKFHNQFLSLSQSTLLRYQWEIDKCTNHDCLGLKPWPVTSLELTSFSQTLKAEFFTMLQEYPGIFGGIGLAFGEVVVGRVGVKSRMDYTCIGDTVNLAARLCSLAQDSQVKIMTHEELVLACELDTFQVINEMDIRGKKSTVRVVQI